MSSTLSVFLQRLAHSKNTPFYATDMSAGLDLEAAIQSDVILSPMKRTLVPTGIAIALPKGYEAQVRSRSGLSIKYGLVVLNAPGTIDADYRGEIQVILINLGETDVVITPGMRIAQLVITTYAHVVFNEVGTLPPTQRQEGGFGSTGL